MILLADIANETENYAQATTILDQIIEINPDEGYLHKLLGDSHRRAGNYANARDAYYQALDFGYSGSGLHRNLGVALEQLDQTEDAETHLKTAIQLNPNDAFALNYLGYWWADQGRNLEQAITLIERAVKLRPDSGYFVDSLGWVHFRLGDADKAVELLERATELEPSDFEIIGHLGDVYWYLNRYDEARFKWRLALSLAKDKADRTKFQDRLKQGLTPAATGGNL
jgi:Flp pilus assembly protein TadD